VIHMAFVSIISDGKVKFDEFYLCLDLRVNISELPSLSLIWHNLYIGVVEKPIPHPPLTEEQYGKMELKCTEGGHCQSVLCPQGVIQWRQQRHLTWSATHDVVSQEINPWKSFDLLLGSNL